MPRPKLKIKIKSSITTKLPSFWIHSKSPSSGKAIVLGKNVNFEQICDISRIFGARAHILTHIAIIFFNDSKKWKCVFFFVNPVLDFERGVLSTLKVFLQTIGSFSNVSFCIFSFCDNYGLSQSVYSVIQDIRWMYYNTVNVVQYNDIVM